MYRKIAVAVDETDSAERLLLGSVSAAVVRAAEIPVLLVYRATLAAAPAL